MAKRTDRAPEFLPLPDRPNFFEGFPPEAFKFLRQLKKNNDREWFQPRKPKYEEYIKQPSLELVRSLIHKLPSSGPRFIAEEKKSVGRIYRDVRFSADKSPYKTHIGFWFPWSEMKSGDWCGCALRIGTAEKGMGIEAGFYFGVYEPGRDQLSRIRAAIDKNPEPFRKLLSSKKIRKEYGEELRGSKLTRMPKNYSEDNQVADLLKYKEYVLMSPIDEDTLTNPSLVDILLKKLKAAEEFAAYFASL